MPVGGEVTLEFTIGYEGTTAATDIEFTDDLDAVLSGLAVIGLPAADVCGSGSELSGTGVISLTGGSLDPGATCTFSVTLAVPDDAPEGVFTNTTSEVSTMVGDDELLGDPASGDLETFVIEEPVIGVPEEPIELWPPNHEYHEISLEDVITDVDDNEDDLSVDDVTITSVTSDEEENGEGDGNTTDDIVIAEGCQSVQLRAERSGGGNGRVYTIHVEATDTEGNTGTASFEVHVPHDQSGDPAIDDGPAYSVEGGCGG